MAFKLPALAYVRSGVTAGLSANAAFREYQAAAAQASEETGQTVTASQRTTFLQMYSDLRNIRGQTAQQMNATRNEPAGGLPIPTRTTVKAEGLIQWGVAFHRLVGSSELEMTFHAITPEQALTPLQVENMIREQIDASSAEAHGTFEQRVLEGVIYTGTEQMVPIGG